MSKFCEISWILKKRPIFSFPEVVAKIYLGVANLINLWSLYVYLKTNPISVFQLLNYLKSEEGIPCWATSCDYSALSLQQTFPMRWEEKAHSQVFLIAISSFLNFRDIIHSIFFTIHSDILLTHLEVCLCQKLLNKICALDTFEKIKVKKLREC